jgi:hypothetical protein
VWVLQATDGPTFRVTATARAARAELTDRLGADDAVVKGARRNLLALLLGRPPLGELSHGGDAVRAQRFSEAFPGP